MYIDTFCYVYACLCVYTFSDNDGLFVSMREQQIAMTVGHSMVQDALDAQIYENRSWIILFWRHWRIRHHSGSHGLTIAFSHPTKTA